MGSKLIDSLHNNPIIAAINKSDALEDALASEVEVIFLLTSNIFDLGDTIKKVQSAGKLVFVHVDLVDGISSNKTGVRYICEVFKPDGIITTKSNLIKVCENYDVITIQRIFLLDSLNFDTGVKSVNVCNPDAVEILPNVIPKIIQKFSKLTRKPIISGGLITTKEDVIESLGAGAIGISTSKRKIWTF